jgi:hypothetical protein
MATTYKSAEGRPFNFSAGPATLPVPVLEQARDEMLGVRGTGISVNEISHRSKAFEAILSEAERDLRALLSVPDNYKVLFVQGGASTQFASLPLNLTSPGDAVDYVVTGAWSKKAHEEAARFGVAANLAAKGDGKSAPPASEWKLTPGAKYVHYCDNETIGGVEYHEAPAVPEGVTLVADMSSDFLSKPVDVAKLSFWPPPSFFFVCALVSFQTPVRLTQHTHNTTRTTHTHTHTHTHTRKTNHHQTNKQTNQKPDTASSTPAPRRTSAPRASSSSSCATT